MVMLKDFIYLDVERVRSYSAQLNGSLIEQTQKTTTHETKANAKVAADGLTKLFINTEAGADYAFQKSNTETSTLHHAAFELLVQNLTSNHLVGDNIYHANRPFSDIVCHLKLVNYTVLAAQLNKMGVLLPLFDKVAGNEQTQEQKQSAEQMQDMSEVINLLYGDTQVLQLINAEERKVIAQIALDENLSLPVRNLFEASSNDILPGEWHVFGIHESEVLNIETQGPDNDIAKALIQASDAVKGIKQTISAVVDAPNVVPIAIYRELG